MKRVWMIIVALTGMVCAEEASLPPAGQESVPVPPEEAHIRAGIVILGRLYNTLAHVRDADSAQAAVPVIVGLTRAVRSWGQAVTGLPLRSPEVIKTYEQRYLPIIDKLNGYLRAQGERLAASNYYDTQDLATALLALYSTVQQ